MSVKNLLTRLTPWIISGAIAICIWWITYTLIANILPDPRYSEELLETTPIKLAAIGSIGSAIPLFVFSFFRDKFIMRGGQSEDGQEIPYRNRYLDTITFALRIVLSGYFVMFWYNYLMYMWFSRISLNFAYTFPAIHIWVLIGCLIALCLLGTFWIICEPWYKFISTHSLDSTLTITETRVAVFVVMNLLFLVFILYEFPFGIVYIIGNTILLIVISNAILFFMHRRQKA